MINFLNSKRRFRVAIVTAVFVCLLGLPTYGSQSMVGLHLAQAANASEQVRPSSRLDEVNEVLRERHIRDYNRLEEPRASDTTEVRDTKLRSYDQFLKDWPAGNPHHNDVQNLRERALDLYRQADAAKAFADNVELLLRQVDALTDVDEQIRVVNDFLDNHPAGDLPPIAIADRDRVQNKLGQLRHHSQAQKWESLKNALTARPDRYSANRDLVRDFIRENPNSPFKAQAEAQIRDIEAAWDKADYHRVQQEWLRFTTQHNPKQSDLDAIVRSLGDYRNRQDPRPAMRQAVVEWLEWYDRVSKQNTVSVFVEKAEVKRGSYLDHRWDIFRPRVVLRVRYDGRLSTNRLKVRRSEGALLAFPFKKTLSDVPNSGLIDLAVESRWGWTPGVPVDAVDPDREIKTGISIASRAVPIMHENQNIGTLYVRVENQPSLPQYRTD